MSEIYILSLVVCMCHSCNLLWLKFEGRKWQDYFLQGVYITFELQDRFYFFASPESTVFKISFHSCRSSPPMARQSIHKQHMHIFQNIYFQRPPLFQKCQFQTPECPILVQETPIFMPKPFQSPPFLSPPNNVQQGTMKRAPLVCPFPFVKVGQNRLWNNCHTNLKERLSQAFMQIGWMEDDFTNLTSKVWANLGQSNQEIWFFKVFINFLYVALSGSTLLGSVMSQQYNCLMELYTNFYKFLLFMKMNLPSSFIPTCMYVRAEINVQAFMIELDQQDYWYIQEN